MLTTSQTSFEKRRIRIEQIQLEMDSGKTIRSAADDFLDLNRAGLALIEIVTAPNFCSPTEAICFVEHLRILLSENGVCAGLFHGCFFDAFTAAKMKTKSRRQSPGRRKCFFVEKWTAGQQSGAEEPEQHCPFAQRNQQGIGQAEEFAEKRGMCAAGDQSRRHPRVPFGLIFLFSKSFTEILSPGGKKALAWTIGSCPSRTCLLWPFSPGQRVIYYYLIR
jgi:hypothetical protein